jgi:hypothetical protein
MGSSKMRGFLKVSPEDPDQVVALKRVLARLSFSAHNDTVSCSKDGLIRLGQLGVPAFLTRSPSYALKCGSEQFKVLFENQPSNCHGPERMAVGRLIQCVHS